MTFEALIRMNYELASLLCSLATLLGLVFTVLILPISARQVVSSFALPDVANYLRQEL